MQRRAFDVAGNGGCPSKNQKGVAARKPIQRVADVLISGIPVSPSASITHEEREVERMLESMMVTVAQHSLTA